MINFAERLKAARKMKGWTLDDLSASMNSEVSKQSLHKYEKGEMEPSEENLLILCDALEIPIDYFYRKLFVQVNSVSFRKLAKYPIRKQEVLLSKTTDFIERYLELEELLGIKSQFNSKKFTGFKISNSEDVELAAEYIRKEWKLGNDALYNVIELLEDNHFKVFEINDDSSFSGMSTIVDKKVPVIVLNENAPIDRKRFTALHELGHIVMNLEEIEEKHHENYCHHFAGAMLVPRDQLRKEIGSEKRTKIYFSELGQLKKQYGISMQALLFRLKMCGHISESLHKFMMIQFSKFGYKQKEPYDYIGEEKSNRFFQLLLRGVAMQLISTSKAAALNNQKLAVFRKSLV